MAKSSIKMHIRRLLASISHGNKVHRVLMGVFICLLSILILSAFSFDQQKGIRRLEFAQFLAKVMSQESGIVSGDGIDGKGLIFFPDLSKEESESISVVIQRKFMSGYSDGNFYPQRNLSQIEYLQSLRSLASLEFVGRKWTVQKEKLISFLGKDFLYDHSYSGFFKSAAFSGKSNSSEVLYESFNLLKAVLEVSSQAVESLPEVRINICGSIVDAINKKPISFAKLFVNNKQIQIDELGRFKIDCAERNDRFEIFADSPNHKSLFIRRRADEKGNIVLRLKPDYRSLFITARSKLTGKKVEQFQVSFDGKNLETSGGKIEIDKISPGRKTLMLKAPGFLDSNESVLLNKKNNRLEIAICPDLSTW